MSLYSEYLQERTNRKIIETEHGFCTFDIFDYPTQKECYIADIYVKADYRRTKEGFNLVDKVLDYAKKIACTHLTGAVCTSAKGSTESMKFILAYGTKLLRCEGNMVYFSKEIK